MAAIVFAINEELAPALLLARARAALPAQRFRSSAVCTRDSSRDEKLRERLGGGFEKKSTLASLTNGQTLWCRCVECQIAAEVALATPLGADGRTTGVIILQ